MAVSNLWVYTTAWKPAEDLAVCMGGSTWKEAVTVSIQKGITNPPVGHEPNPNDWETFAYVSPVAPPTQPGPAVSLTYTKNFGTLATWTGGGPLYLLYEVDYQAPYYNRGVYVPSPLTSQDAQSWGSLLGDAGAQVRVAAARYNDGGIGPFGPWSSWVLLRP